GRCDLRHLDVGLYLSVEEARQALMAAGHCLADARAVGALRPRWEGYIVFPWNDEHGRPLPLHGTWQSRPPAEGKPKKYALESAKGEDGEPWEATKRSPLYFDRARCAGHRSLVLVEGVTDAGLAQARGDTRVVACVAAELSRLQVQTLARCGVQAGTIALDPDSPRGDGIAPPGREGTSGGHRRRL